MEIISTQATTGMHFRLSTNLLIMLNACVGGLLCAILLMPAIARAQSLDAAHAFAVRLYQPYSRGVMPDYNNKAAMTFAPRLLTLMHRDEKETPPGDIGYLDGDPICDCQETDGLSIGEIKVARLSPQRAKAVATLKFPSETRAVTLDLIALKGRWWIADVGTNESPSLVKALEQHLSQMSRQGRHR